MRVSELRVGGWTIDGREHVKYFEEEMGRRKEGNRVGLDTED